MEFQQQNNINEPQPIACDRRNRVATVSLSGTQPCPLAVQELSGWRLLVSLGRSRPPDLILKGKENPWPEVPESYIRSDAICEHGPKCPKVRLDRMQFAHGNDPEKCPPLEMSTPGKWNLGGAKG